MVRDSGLLRGFRDAVFGRKNSAIEADKITVDYEEEMAKKQANALNSEALRAKRRA